MRDDAEVGGPGSGRRSRSGWVQAGDDSQMIERAGAVVSDGVTAGD